MSKRLLVDLDFDGVARTINALDPINDQDYVTVNWFKSLIKRMTISQATTSITFANLSELTSISLPVGNYSFTALIKVQSVLAATGYGIRLGVGSATLSNLMAAWQLPSNPDYTTTHFNSYAQRAVADNNINGTIGAGNTDYLAIGNGFFSVTAAGTVAVQVRSEIALSAVTFGVGSCFKIERLP